MKTFNTPQCTRDICCSTRKYPEYQLECKCDSSSFPSTDNTKSVIKLHDVEMWQVAFEIRHIFSLHESNSQSVEVAWRETCRLSSDRTRWEISAEIIHVLICNQLGGFFSCLTNVPKVFSFVWIIYREKCEITQNSHNICHRRRMCGKSVKITHWWKMKICKVNIWAASLSASLNCMRKFDENLL